MRGVMTRRMPRFLASVAIVAAVGAIAAPAAKAQQFWGGGYISDMEGCDPVSFGGGVAAVTARYEPGELDGNSDTALTIIHGSTYVFNLSVDDGAFEEEFTGVRGMHMLPTVERMRPNPRVRVTRQNPNVLDDDSDRVRLRLQVRNLFAIQGCRGTIELEMVRR